MSEGAKCATATDILEADDLKRVRVDVPEWGADRFVYVRELSGPECAELGKDNETGTVGTARLVTAATCDETGALIFTEAHVAALAGKSLAVLKRLQDAIMDVNAFSLTGAKDAEENSEAAQSGSSLSDSPSPSDAPSENS